jgi:hypothetical protein
MAAIQIIKGSQYLHKRPSTPARNNIERADATGKMGFRLFAKAGMIMPE